MPFLGGRYGFLFLKSGSLYFKAIVFKVSHHNNSTPPARTNPHSLSLAETVLRTFLNRRRHGGACLGTFVQHTTRRNLKSLP